jgi:N-acylneuraminate cytidylyltransferase
MMRIAIVPARGGSKRIPKKNIIDFHGRPLMSYPIRAAERSGLFDAIHVSTDSPRIAEVAAALKHPVDFMRDPTLADDHTPLLPVLQWTLDQYAQRGRRFESVCLLMPTAPLIDADDLKQAETIFRDHGATHTVMAIARFPAPIEWAFRLDETQRLVPCQPRMAAVRSQDLAPAYYDTGTFLFIPEADVRAGRLDEERIVPYHLSRRKAVDIDDYEDLELARVLYRGGAA